MADNTDSVIPPFESTVSIVLTALIPIIAAAVGYGTNIVAIRMTFYPLEYIGLRPCGMELPGVLGWQVRLAGRCDFPPHAWIPTLSPIPHRQPLPSGLYLVWLFSCYCYMFALCGCCI